MLGCFGSGPPYEIQSVAKTALSPCDITAYLPEYRPVLDELTKERNVPVLTSVLKIREFHSEMSSVA